MTKVTCASSDDTGSTGLHNIPHDTSTFANVTLATADYSLVSGSGLIDAGTNTRWDAAPLDFATDIAGKSR
jgi:hypothetical protein